MDIWHASRYFLLLPSVPLSICKVDGPLEAGVGKRVLVDN